MNFNAFRNAESQLRACAYSSSEEFAKNLYRLLLMACERKKLHGMHFCVSYVVSNCMRGGRKRNILKICSAGS